MKASCCNVRPSKWLCALFCVVVAAVFIGASIRIHYEIIRASVRDEIKDQCYTKDTSSIVDYSEAQGGEGKK